MALYKTCHTLTHVVPSIGLNQKLSWMAKAAGDGQGWRAAERDQENFKGKLKIVYTQPVNNKGANLPF